jgi:hypothetical protein
VPATEVLPVSGIRLHLREPTGEDELVAREQADRPAATILELAGRLARDDAGRPVTWLELPAVELAAAALLIRSTWLGERIHTETLCPVPDCGEPIDVTFLISEYLDHHRPGRFRGLLERPDGWFGLAGSETSFRVPTVEDLITASREHRDANWISERCIRPADAPPAVRRRVERALERIAPRLDDLVVGRCPACGADVELFFDPISYVTAELRDVSAGLYADVHELAFAYRWSEASILALGRGRRHSYVAMVRGDLALT